MKTTPFQNSVDSNSSPIILILLICFAFFQRAEAVNPPPDGGYPGGNTAEGQNALFSLTTGTYNTAVGLFSLETITAGSFNTAIGAGTLLLTTGNENTATGAGALFSNTTGSSNTATGESAAFFNASGSNNTVVGASALLNNVAGANNTAVGYQTLLNNVTDGNTATGFQALQNNTTGDLNTATGNAALSHNSTGRINTANGFQALNANTNGLQNTAIGTSALIANTSGNGNTAAGSLALSNNTTGSANVALGIEAGSNVTTANNIIVLGAEVPGANVSDTTWIGNVFGVTPQSGTMAQVVVSDDGQLGTVASSERFKKDVATMDKSSEEVLLLRPVTFHYRTDSKDVPQFGLIAEEVAKVDPALVLPDKEGKPYTVRYDAVNAMLLNEFLKEHKTVQEQAATVAQMQRQIETLTAGLQKLSAQVDASKAASQVALKDR